MIFEDFRGLATHLSAIQGLTDQLELRKQLVERSLGVEIVGTAASLKDLVAGSSGSSLSMDLVAAKIPVADHAIAMSLGLDAAKASLFEKTSSQALLGNEALVSLGERSLVEESAAASLKDLVTAHSLATTDLAATKVLAADSAIATSVAVEAAKVSLLEKFSNQALVGNESSVPLGEPLAWSPDTAQKRVSEYLAQLQPLSTIGVLQTEIQTALRGSAGLNPYGEEALGGINWRQLNAYLGPTESLQRAYAELTSAYSALDELNSRSEAVRPTLLSALPGIEVYAHAMLLRSLSRGGAPASRKQRSEGEPEHETNTQSQEQISEETGFTLEGLLATYYPGLIHMWQGANAVLSSNPDHVRQYCVSQRQLLLDLLAIAAPESEVRRWTSDPELFQQRKVSNQPTWRARILYLYAKADREKYGNFAISDARSALQVYNRLNRGVHQSDPAFDQREIADLRVRANCLLLFVMMISIQAQD